MIHLRVTPVKNVVMDVMESKLFGGSVVELQGVEVWSRDSDVTKLGILVSPVGH